MKKYKQSRIDERFFSSLHAVIQQLIDNIVRDSDAQPPELLWNKGGHQMFKIQM